MTATLRTMKRFILLGVLCALGMLGTTGPAEAQFSPYVDANGEERDVEENLEVLEPLCRGSGC